MVQMFTNRQQIAGLPALSVVAFLAADDEEVSLRTIGRWFRLDDVEARAAAERLENEGYIEPLNEGAGTWSKTSVARDTPSTLAQAEMSDVERDELVLALVRAVGEVNVNPATAHRVGALTFIGESIVRGGQPPSLVEALVEISPFTHVENIQAGVESLAASHADRHLQDAVPEADAHARSIQLIKETLWSVGERLSLRFVMR